MIQVLYTRDLTPLQRSRSTLSLLLQQSRGNLSFLSFFLSLHSFSLSFHERERERKSSFFCSLSSVCDACGRHAVLVLLVVVLTRQTLDSFFSFDYSSIYLFVLFAQEEKLLEVIQWVDRSSSSSLASTTRRGFRCLSFRQLLVLVLQSACMHGKCLFLGGALFSLPGKEKEKECCPCISFSSQSSCRKTGIDSR